MLEEGDHAAAERSPGAGLFGGPQAAGGFEGHHGWVEWRADGGGLVVVEGGQEHSIGWDAVSRAGLMEFSSGAAPRMFPLYRLPGLRRWAGQAVLRSMEWRQLMVAAGTKPSSVFRLPVPAGAPGEDALVEAVRGHVGDRWVGVVSAEAHYDALGIRTPWYYTPLILAAAAIAALLVLLLGGLVYVGITTVTGHVPTVAWIGLLALLVLGNQIRRKIRGR